MKTKPKEHPNATRTSDAILAYALEIVAREQAFDEATITEHFARDANLPSLYENVARKRLTAKAAKMIINQSLNNQADEYVDERNTKHRHNRTALDKRSNPTRTNKAAYFEPQFSIRHPDGSIEKAGLFLDSRKAKGEKAVEEIKRAMVRWFVRKHSMALGAKVSNPKPGKSDSNVIEEA
jgi:hypothetical protein